MILNHLYAALKRVVINSKTFLHMLVLKHLNPEVSACHLDSMAFRVNEWNH